MPGIEIANSVMVGDEDVQIIRALQISPRVGFARMATVLGFSELTVARRYRRLLRTGVLHVVGVLNPWPLGQATWRARVRCRPDGTVAIADAVARREDVSWVALSAAGSEVTFAVRSRSSAQREDLLVQRLPRSAAVIDLDVSVVMHQFMGGRGHYWSRLSGALTREQEAELGSTDLPFPLTARPAEIVTLGPHDEAILRALAADGRATHAELAAAARISPGRAARRMEALLQAGVVYLDVEVPPTAIGLGTVACLWMRVTPATLKQTGEALARMPEVAFAAAISGAHNLTASVVCRDLDELYAFVTDRIGALEGVQTLEVSPVYRQVKLAGTLMNGDRLATSD